jgi:diguanylate cyclase (GGDEF)-like protein
LTERKRLEDELRHLAFHDALTQLPNRRLLLDRLTQALHASKRQNSYGAVLFLDLNHFKQLNDTHGHAVGDLLLIEVAQRLRQVVRDQDTVARLGGDEFLVLLDGLGVAPGQAADYARAVADKIGSRLSETYQLGDVRYQGSVSLGIKLFHGDDSDAQQILQAADAAMYQSKRGATR